jgi:serine protease Do
MRKQAHIPRIVAGALVVAISFLGFATNAAAQPVSAETLIGERTKPAVQLIQTSYTATVSARPTLYSKAGEALLKYGIYKWSIGELRSESDVIEYVFQRIADNPTYYLREAGERQTKTLRQTGYGSGFVASPDGYVVTAKHVVTADTELTKSFAQQGAKWFTEADAKEWIKAYKKYDLSNEAMKNIQVAVAAFYENKVNVRVGTPTVSVIMSTASADGSPVGKGFPADVVYRSGSVAGEDVAVLHIQVGQLPSLALASANAVQGATVYIHGYPLLPADSEAAFLQPTLTKGQITAIKPNQAGLQQLQHNATTSGGASGAAAFNEAGEVIGIHVAGAVNSSNGNALGQGYLMPLDSVRSALARSGATPNQGETTTLYNDALNNFYADHYSVALTQFRQVKELFPAHAYAGSYISQAQLAISQDRDVPVDPPLPWMPILIGAGVLLLACSGALGYGVSRRSRRKSDGADYLTRAADNAYVASNAPASMDGYHDVGPVSHFDHGTGSNPHPDDDAEAPAAVTVKGFKEPRSGMPPTWS